MRAETTFVCEYCGKRFTTLEPCRKHERIHTEKKVNVNIQAWDGNFNSIVMTLDNLRNLKDIATVIYIKDEESRKVWKEIYGSDMFCAGDIYYDHSEDGWINLTMRQEDLETELSFINDILDETINKVIDK